MTASTPRVLQAEDLCPCGSGKSFGECCLKEGRAYYRDGVPVIRRLLSECPPCNPTTESVEPNIDLVPSIEFEGKRVRILHNTLHICPETQTFHEFLIGLIQQTLGIPWWKHQVRTALENRHVIAKWKYAFARATKRPSDSIQRLEDDRAFIADASGPVWSLLMLGYDLYCLKAENQLPAFLVERLRRNQSFQSARYEVGVAAIMARGNYDITFLDDQERAKKHCEFIGRHKPTGIVVAVEAKSRRRAGVLHEKGQFAYDGDVRGIAKLVRTAKGQRPEGIPFLIFVDMNLPLSPATPPEAKPWLNDVKLALDDRFGTPSAVKPDPFTALIATNFALHYGGEDIPVGRGEWGVVIPRYPEVAVPDSRALHDVWQSLHRYDDIPAEV